MTRCATARCTTPRPRDDRRSIASPGLGSAALDALRRASSRTRGASPATRLPAPIAPRPAQELADLGDRARKASPPRSPTATCAPTPRRSRSAGWRAPASRASCRRARAFTTTSCGRATPTQNPAELLPTPEARLAAAPRARPATRSRSCSTAFPPRRRSRSATGRIFELAYSCGLRAEEITLLDLDGARLRRRDRSAYTARATRRASPRSASRPSARCAAISSAAGRRSTRRPGETRAVPLAARAAALALGRPQAAGQVGPRGGHRRAGLAAHAAPLLRHPPARGRRRPAIDPGAARPREHLDDPDLHPGRAGTPAQRVRTQLTRAALSWRPATNVPRLGEAPEHGDERQGGGAARAVASLQGRRRRRARERLVVAYSPLVKFIAGRMASGLPRTSRSPTSSPTGCSA